MAFMRMKNQSFDTQIRLYGLREGAARYGLGLTTFRKFADEVGATVHIGKRVLFDADVLDKAIDELHNKQED